MEKYSPGEKPTLIIGGGVGPMAGVELHRKIIEQTKTTGIDQDHFDLIHISVSRTIGDRTDYLLGKNSTNPGEKMAAAVGLGLAGLLNEKACLDSSVVVGVPCNTFHEASIYSVFEENLSEWGPRVQIVHMLREAIGLIKKISPEARSIGLMSTTGTRRSRVWHNLLETHNYSVLEVSETEQEKIHEAIYNRSWGLKAASPASAEARSAFEGFAQKLVDRGAEVLIPGCTEIPLALPGITYGTTPLVDPVFALARGMIYTADPARLRK